MSKRPKTLCREGHDHSAALHAAHPSLRIGEAVYRVAVEELKLSHHNMGIW